ncbi:hypothetical protein Btru_070314 [Bulinus truncatus]|nr:hypothetical protein Btru_070314 [Bulinus truncatus]
MMSVGVPVAALQSAGAAGLAVSTIVAACRVLYWLIYKELVYNSCYVNRKVDTTTVYMESDDCESHISACNICQTNTYYT